MSMTIREVICDVLRDGEAYSLEITRQWYIDEWDGTPHPSFRSAQQHVTKELRAMECEGLLTSRLALPGEHRGSWMARRYYAIAQPAKRRGRGLGS